MQDSDAEWKLQKKVKKMQTDLEKARWELAQQGGLKMEKARLEEQLEKEKEEAKQGRDLWKLNRALYHILRQVVTDSRDFAKEVRDDAEQFEASGFKQRLQHFETKLAITAGRRDAAEAQMQQMQGIQGTLTLTSDVEVEVHAGEPSEEIECLSMRAQCLSKGPKRSTKRCSERGTKRRGQRGTERCGQRGAERRRERGTERGRERGSECSSKRLCAQSGYFAQRGTCLTRATGFGTLGDAHGAHGIGVVLPAAAADRHRAALGAKVGSHPRQP
ncbi:unnamed protein product [Effrenium voratum]|nr:unnamed protein product [Effrenium voratum]